MVLVLSIHINRIHNNSNIECFLIKNRLVEIVAVLCGSPTEIPNWKNRRRHLQGDDVIHCLILLWVAQVVVLLQLSNMRPLSPILKMWNRDWYDSFLKLHY